MRTMTMRSQSDGLELSLMITEPKGQVCGLLQLSHGMSEHKERYLPFMEYLSEQGLVCVINDHRGHGASVRDRKDLGYFYENGAESLLQDLHMITLWMRQQWPDKKLILMGHSMGSLAVRAYADRWDRDIDALIVCGSPGYNSATGMGLAIVKILKLIKGEHFRSALLEKMSIGPYRGRFPDPKHPSAWLSVDSDNVAAYEADPLCGFNFTLNGNEALLNLMKRAYGIEPKQGRERLPIRFYSGADDPCAPDRKGFDHAIDCMRKAGFTDVSGYMFPGMRHEILNEAEKQTVWERMYKEAMEPVLS